MIKGTITALVTPFTERGDLDLEATERLVESQIAGGVEGLVVLGTTGESPAISDGERKTLLASVQEMVKDRCLLVAGTGTNNTVKSISQTRDALDIGYRFALVVTPYYNKPTQQGLYEHFSMVASEVPGAGIIVYNVPGRTGVNINPDTVIKLAQAQKNIVAVKEASGNLDQVNALVRSGIPVLSGDDALTLPMMSIGAVGVISVASNPAPGLMSDMVRAALDGDFVKARELHGKLYPLFRVLFLETSPGPVKAALAEMGICGSTLRPPLAAISPATLEELKKALKETGC